MDRLTPALLAKAFRGELVPQDPNDEAASVLLERIRAARQAEAAAGKPSRRGRRKAAAHPDQYPLPAAPAPPDLLAQLLQECGALSERALLAIRYGPKIGQVPLEVALTMGPIDGSPLELLTILLGNYQACFGQGIKSDRLLEISNFIA